MINPVVDAAGGKAGTLTGTTEVEPLRGPWIAGGIAVYVSFVKAMHAIRIVRQSMLK